MTDKLAGKDDSQRLLGYVESVAKESRKALTLEFNEKHKGIPFNTTGQILRDSLVAWFGRRDKNLRITAETVNSAKLGRSGPSLVERPRTFVSRFGRMQHSRSRVGQPIRLLISKNSTFLSTGTVRDPRPSFGSRS